LLVITIASPLSLADTITPDPKLLPSSGWRGTLSPKKNLKNGSFTPAATLARFCLVNTFTTALDERCAASANEAIGAVGTLLRGASLGSAGALLTCGACSGTCLSQLGFNVVTTNNAATQTVTACAKISHSFFIGTNMSISRFELLTACNNLLQPQRFKDYCPNGLQVEGIEHISRLALAVTANQGAIDAALQWGAQALLVHHGLMWKGDDGTVTGHRKMRLATALNADLNLLAYHLPLDAHPTLGNNAQLGVRLGLNQVSALDSEGILVAGSLLQACLASEFAAHVSARLDRAAQLIGNSTKPLQRIAWCTGGGGSYFEAAIAAGVDAFLTGEASEQHVHIACECGVPLILAGHHATERYGVQALGAQLRSDFDLDIRFFEIDSPL
jgi:dinuclear metal center YbgI/SA1388 family protein